MPEAFAPSPAAPAPPAAEPGVAGDGAPEFEPVGPPEPGASVTLGDWNEIAWHRVGQDERTGGPSGPSEPAAAEPIATTEPAVAAEPIAAAEPVATTEPAVAAEPIATAEPVAPAEPVASAEPAVAPAEPAPAPAERVRTPVWEETAAAAPGFESVVETLVEEPPAQEPPAEDAPEPPPVEEPVQEPPVSEPPVREPPVEEPARERISARGRAERLRREEPASAGPGRERVPSHGERGRMRRRARYLRALREIQLRDIGGFALELHRYGQQRPDLLEAKITGAAVTDTELRALERALDEGSAMRELREAGIGGACDNCGAVYGSTDRYCATCGEALDMSLFEDDGEADAR